jgi:hypothetical protein
MAADWKRINADIFWGEIAPCEHVVQIYENDGVFLDALSGFVGGGINAGDCVIVIATAKHLEALESRLFSYGVRTDTLVQDDRYIPLDAAEVLSRCMVDGWPDEALFVQTVTSIINRGQCRKRRIRAFGEMVALLWAQGLNGATVHLEFLWNKFCEARELCLFCAYPKTGFTMDINESIMTICGCHSKMIGGAEKQLTEILYTNPNHRIA